MSLSNNFFILIIIIGIINIFISTVFISSRILCIFPIIFYVMLLYEFTFVILYYVLRACGLILLANNISVLIFFIKSIQRNLT